jgi:hypothetical protein
VPAVLSLDRIARRGARTSGSTLRTVARSNLFAAGSRRSPGVVFKDTLDWISENREQVGPAPFAPAS